MEQKLLAFSLNKSLFDLAFAVGKIFSTLYFYLIFNNSLVIALGVWVAISLMHMVFTLATAKIAGRIGTRNSLSLAIFLFFISSLAVLFLDRTNPWPYFITWAVVYAFARAIYYIPYHIYVIKLTESESRGEQVSKLMAISILLSIFTPLIGGFLSQEFGLIGVATFSGVVSLISLAPLFRIPNYKYQYTGRIWEIFTLPTTKKEFKLLVTSDLQNKEIFWQIYVFLLLKNNFLDFGMLFTIVNLVSFAITWFSGKLMDHRNLKNIIHVDAILTALIWLTRPLATNPIAITISNTVYELVSNSRNQVANSIDYKLITHNETIELFDERLVAKEVYLNIFSALGTFVCIVLAVYLDMNAVFIFAGLAALLFLLF